MIERARLLADPHAPGHTEPFAGEGWPRKKKGARISESSTPVSPALFQYIANHTEPEDDFLKKLKRSAQLAGIPPIWIAAEQGSFLQILLRIARAREVVEVGTHAGYSAIWMARGLPPEGRIRTVEILEHHARFAEEWIGRSDVAGKVAVHRGAAQEVLPGFAAESADAAFIDADKAGYQRYLDECIRIVRPGGLVMADNAFAFGHLLDRASQDFEVEMVRAFNETVSAEKRLVSIMVPLGDGLWVCVKR